MRPSAGNNRAYRIPYVATVPERNLRTRTVYAVCRTVENLWVCEGENIPIVFRLRVMF